MIWTNLPSLNALKAFCALAETGSYAKAGTALNVTHAAVLQQVRSLEKDLEVSLVSRAGRGVELTEDGEALARELDVGFLRLQRGVERVAEAGNLRPVQITTSPAFAVKWLMPKIADFQVRHPDITLLLNPTGQIVDLKHSNLDLAIRYSSADQAHKDMDVLFRVDLGVIATPKFKTQYSINRAADLEKLPWLQELGTNEVAQWFERRGVVVDRQVAISHMPGNLVLDAVKRGDGITLTARQWVEDELASGELDVIWPEEDQGLFHIQLATGASRRSVRVFRDWLKLQVENE
ncbi:MAG: LysR family transcriptional regulator [Rhodobacteraceae bacterium]|nr:LysR family transcriptional regulator [Paracoccaceae bacterium]